MMLALWMEWTFLALVLAGMLERETRDAGGSLLGMTLMLSTIREQLRVRCRSKVASVFSRHGQSDPRRIAGRNMRQVADGPEVSEEFEALAEFRRWCWKSRPRCACHGPFSPTRCARMDSLSFFGNVFFGIFRTLRRRGETFPFEFDAGVLEYAKPWPEWLGADAVAGWEWLCVPRLLRCCAPLDSRGELSLRNSIRSLRFLPLGSGASSL